MRTIALLAGALVAFAAHAASVEAIRLEVQVIEAGHGAAALDARLAYLESELGELSYDHFILRDEATLSLPPGAGGNVQLPTGHWLVVRPLEVVGRTVRFELSVKALKLATVARAGFGHTLLVGRIPNGDSDILLAVKPFATGSSE